MSVLDEIAAERRRQIEKGYTAEHDDQHVDGELADAAAAYATGYAGWWPWSLDTWKPADSRRQLIIAAAFLMAEIERIDRKEGKK